MQTSDEPALTGTPAALPARGKARRRRATRRWIVVGAIVAVAGLLALGVDMTAGGWVGKLLGREDPTGTFYVAEPTTLSITLTEDGELKPCDSIEMKCEVEGQSTILFLIEESTRVQKGDLLVELASDAIQERLRSKEMELRRIRADYEAAVAELEIQKNQNASNIRKAEIDLEVAELDLQKYIEGDFEVRQKEIDVQIQQTEMEIARKEAELQESLELQQKGWLTRSEVEQLEFALKVAKMQLERHRLSKRILLQYERPMFEKQRRSAVDRAAEELERETKRAQSREKQSQARVDQYRDQLDKVQADCDRLHEQLDHCKIYAPADGVVQYPTAGRRWGYNRVAAGEKVFEGQTLVVLPDTSQMLVETRIHEADRHKVEEGMPCIIKILAVPGETFTGTITKIGRYADSENRWLNPDLKEHPTEILLDKSDPALSPGDSAEVRILIDTIEDALAVPVQCVFTRGARSFVFVERGGSIEPTEVELGSSNTSMIDIVDGLHAGQRVLMTVDEGLLTKLPSVEFAEAMEHMPPETPEPTGKPAPAPKSGKKEAPPRQTADKSTAEPSPKAAGGQTPAKRPEN